MNGRKKFKYRAQVQRSNDGRIFEEEVVTYWTPEKDYVIDAVARTGAAQAAMTTRDERGHCIPHVGLSAVLAD